MPDSKLGGHYSPLTLSPRDRQSGHTQHHCPPKALWRPLALLGLVSAACHGCTPRQRLWSKEGHGLGGRGWLRIGKGIPVLTVHALLKGIPAREGQVRSFQSLFYCEDRNSSRATKVSGLLLRGVQRWEGQLPAGSVPCGWVCLGTARMEEQSCKTPGLICWMGPMANISCTLTLPGTV